MAEQKAPEVQNGTGAAVQPMVTVSGPLGARTVRAGGEPIHGGLPIPEQQAAEPDPAPAPSKSK